MGKSQSWFDGGNLLDACVRPRTVEPRLCVVAVLGELRERAALRASAALVDTWVGGPRIVGEVEGEEPLKVCEGGFVGLIQDLEVVASAVFGLVGNVDGLRNRRRCFVLDLEMFETTVLGLIGNVGSRHSLHKQYRRGESDQGRLDGEHLER
jgi:hypothetical protein